MKNRIYTIKAINQIGLGVLSLITPIIILKITGSIVFAGWAILVEWFPKLLMYINGANIYAKNKKAPLFFNIIKIISLLFICLSLLNNSYMYLLIGVFLFHGSNTFNNLLMEWLIAVWWDKKDYKSGHSNVLIITLIVNIFVVSLLSLLDIKYMILTVFSICVLNLILDYSIKFNIYEKIEIKNTSTQNFIHDFKYVLSNDKLLYLALLGMFINSNTLIVVNNIAFLINDYDKILSQSTVFSGYFKAFISLFGIMWIYVMKKINCNYKVILLNSFIAIIINVLLYYNNQFYMMIFLCLLYGILGFGFAPSARTVRQYLLGDNAIRYTGNLIAIEMAGFLLAGIMLITIKNVYWCSLLHSLFIFICLFFVIKKTEKTDFVYYEK